MKKSYLLLLMLLTVTLTVTAKKRTRVYDFSYNSADYQAATNNREFKFTQYTYVNKIHGYQDRNGQEYKTEKIVDGYDHRFAFYTTRWHWKKNYSAGYDNQYLKNNTDYTNIFSVLNLRAGDIVRIKCQDLRTTEPIGKRFITAYSANCINNRRWSVSDPAVDKVEWLKEAYHEFIMKEDGNLDLNCAPLLEIENVEIISPFTDFNYKEVTHEQFDNGGVLETEDIYINPWNKDRGEDGDPKIVWQKWEQPVVLVRGDLQGTPKAEIISGNANFSTRVRVSGLSGRGGTVVVMLERCMYTFTIPYKVADGSKAWNFWSNPLAVGRSTENGTEGPDKLSLQFHDQAYGISKRQWYHDTNASGSIYTTLYDEWMNGQNAYLNEETAGLIFFSDTNGDIEDPTNEDQDGGWRRRTYGYENETTVADGGGERYLTIRKNGGFIIPDLEKGDQVYIYMVHSINGAKGVQLDNGSYKDGVKFTVTNALDALKNPITTPVCTGGSTWGPWISSGKWSRQYYGAMHFYAAAKGDMKFTFDGFEDKDYVKLCYIRIYRHDQDIITITEDMVSNTGGYEILVRQNANGTFEPTELHTLELRTTQAVGVNQQFEVLECSGNLTKDKFSGWCTTRNRGYSTNPMIYDINVNTNEPVFGAALVRGKDYDHNNKYCMNYVDRVIAVGTLQQMNYPYTWDFKDILGRGNSSSLFTADASQLDTHITGNKQTAYGDSTRIWTKNGSDFEINNSAFANGNRNWSSGSQLFARGEFIEEAAGVGFATWNQAGSTGGGSRNGDIAITSEGVKIMPQNQSGMTRVFVPKLKKGMRLYLQGKRYTGGTSGFGVSYLTGKSDLPRVNNPWNTDRYHDNDGYDENNKWSNKPLLKDVLQSNTVHIIKGNDESEIEYDNFLYNFTTLDMEQNEKTEDIAVDEHLTIKATEDKFVEYGQGASNTVNNSAGLFVFERQDGNNVYAKVNGTSKLVQYVDEFGNKVNDEDAVADKHGNLIYDSNNVTLAEDDNTYVNMLKLRGAGSNSSRVAKISLNSEKTYKVTVVLKSENSSENRQLKIYGGDWNGTELATMLARNKVMAKTIDGVTGYSSITIGSQSSGIEIYAIYVEEDGQSNSVNSMDFLAYIDMDEANFYGQDATNVTLYLSDVLIERMAVTNDKKELNDIGWASESRDYYIDHRLNPVFNGVPVKAYVANGTAVSNEDGRYNGLINGIVLTELTQPMDLTEDGVSNGGRNTGCVLHNANNEGVEGGIYLFVPAIWDYLADNYISNANFIGDACTNGCKISTGNKSHANADAAKINDMSENMMIANLGGATVPYSGTTGEYTNYVLSYKYTDGMGNSHPAAGEAKTERFVRVGKGGATGKSNTAYLHLKTSDVKPADYNDERGSNLIIIFDGENQGTDPDGIDDLYISNGTEGSTGSDSYYTLSGQKVNNPTKPGVYVKNGKKVFVK